MKIRGHFRSTTASLNLCSCSKSRSGNQRIRWYRYDTHFIHRMCHSRRSIQMHPRIGYFQDITR